MNPSTNEINPSTNQSFNPINESTNPSIDPSKMEPSQPVRKRGRPKKEKPPESSQPVRKRGRPRKEPPPPRSQEDIDDMPPAAAPPFVERLDSTLTNMKGMKDLIKNAKNTVQKFGSALPSLLNEFGPMLADLCDAYVHEKEYHAKVQNANQDFHGTYRVYLRVKPTLGEDGSVVEFTPENDPHSVTAPSLGATSEFGKLNGVFAKHESQAQVFEKLQPLVRRVVEGSNVCFLAYGQSGSGKTFSLFGPSNKGILSDKNGGICQLAIGEIMKLAVGWNFEFSMEEVKGKEAVYLSEPAMVNDFEDVISRLQEGFKDRACSPTNLNQQSSRSHCIVKLKLQRKDANETICGGRLYMVDLAGTEKVKQSKVEGSHLKTSSKINTSLFQLSMVMQALSKKADFVPYSSAVLTSHLKECLDRNSKVVLLAHVSPLEEFYNETTETLDFAKTTAQVRNGVLESLDRDAERLELLIKKHTRKKL